MEEKKFNTLVAELQQRSAAKCYWLSVDETVSPRLTDSKLGGLPYWDLSRPYPRDSKGGLMALLAQVNFGKAHMRSPLPTKGMLQVFLSVDETFLFGLDRDAEGRQSNFRVVYHETVSADVSAEDVAAIGMPQMTKETYSPVNGEYALRSRSGVSYMSMEDYRWGALLSGTVKDCFGETVDPEMPWDYLTGEENDRLRQLLQAPPLCHQMLGQPDFEQGDPRRKNRQYDTLLLQIDSDCPRDAEKGYRERVMWGDMGIGGFYINGEALLRRDFSDVLYAWECG